VLVEVHSVELSSSLLHFTCVLILLDLSKLKTVEKMLLHEFSLSGITIHGIPLSPGRPAPLILSHKVKITNEHGESGEV